MSSPINYDTLPESLAGPLSTWEDELAKFYAELLRAAVDATGHLDKYVGAYLDMSNAELQANQQACADWEYYLINQMWDAVENAWLAAQAHDGIPHEAVQLDQQYRRLASAAHLVLRALQVFFASILSDTTSAAGLARQARDDYEQATADGGPNNAPLPNPWNATPQLMPADMLVREILISQEGMTQNINIDQQDIADFAGLTA